MAREIVTSENREEYMEKKMAEKEGKRPSLEMLKLYNKGFKQFAGSPKQKKTLEEIEKQKKKESMNDEQLERVKNHPKYAKLVVSLGKKGAMDALLKELNEKQ